MGSSNIKSFEKWIENKALSLPMPEDELLVEFYQASRKIFGKEEASKEIYHLMKVYWNKLSYINSVKISEIPHKALVNIKHIANSTSQNLEAIFESTDYSYYKAKSDIERFLNKRITSNDKERNLMFECKKKMILHMKEFIYDIFQVSANNEVEFFMKDILEEKEKAENKYQCCLDTPNNREDRRDMMELCILEFKENYRGCVVRSKVLDKIIEKYLKESLMEKLKNCLEKDLKSFEPLYLFEYDTNDEIQHKSEKWIKDFENHVLNKYGVISEAFKKDFKASIYSDIKEKWRETIANSNINEELFKFTKYIINEIRKGSIKLFDVVLCKDVSLIKELLISSIPYKKDKDRCLSLLSELSIYLDHQFYFNFKESESPQSQNFLENLSIEGRFFFLICTILVISRQHYKICLELKTSQNRDFNIRNFRWLLNIIKASFKLEKFIPNLQRFDNPMLLCSIIISAVKEEINSEISDKTFLSNLEEYSNNLDLKVEEQRRIKRALVKDVTFTVSGFNYENCDNFGEITKIILEEMGTKKYDFKHLLNLPKQGATYEYSWDPGKWPKLCMKIFKWNFVKNYFKDSDINFRSPEDIESWYSRDAESVPFLNFIHIPTAHEKSFKRKLRKSKKNIVTNILDKFSDWLFDSFKKQCKSWGIMLAKIITSGDFEDSKINLIGYSLGCDVIYHCLNYLFKMKKTELINNVILLGGASSVDNDWKSCRSIVMDRFINVRSTNDVHLYWLYQMSENEEPIGLRKINVDGIEDYETEVSHLNYSENMGEIFKNIRYEGR